jgi:hypothetical protein
MKRDIKEYQLVESGTIENVEKKVNELIQKGWQPLGGVSISGDKDIVQPMVKYQDNQYNSGPK